MATSLCCDYAYRGTQSFRNLVNLLCFSCFSDSYNFFYVKVIYVKFVFDIFQKQLIIVLTSKGKHL